MIINIDRQELWLVGGVVAVLVVATIAGVVLQRTARTDSARATVSNLNLRVRAWWVIVAVLVVAILTGLAGTVILFALLSFLALREFVTLIPTRAGDHRALLWIFFIITPLQYALVAAKWYGLFSILIPVYAFLLLPARIALRGDAQHFLERAAELQWALMICVYSLSYAPALGTLTIPGYTTTTGKLLIYLILVVEASDVLQYVWGKLLGKRRIAPAISPNKTWAGFIGGVGSATLVGASLWWFTPFNPLEAAGMSFAITLMGFAGGLTMSAIKRDRGIKDYGTLIAGHGGVLDRIDSLCFAAPIFFHLTRYFFAR